jgi:hypothetical protein
MPTKPLAEKHIQKEALCLEDVVQKGSKWHSTLFILNYLLKKKPPLNLFSNLNLTSFFEKKTPPSPTLSGNWRHNKMRITLCFYFQTFKLNLT